MCVIVLYSVCMIMAWYEVKTYSWIQTEYLICNVLLTEILYYIIV